MAEGPLKALFFVTRSDGTMVPLLSVDEFPHHINVIGAPRIMSVFDITGMTCVGRSDFRHRHYDIKTMAKPANMIGSLPNNQLRARYFLTRDSGNMVPLVAMDEMPQGFVVEGVPRAVSIFDIGGMTCVGVADVREQTHMIEDVMSMSASDHTIGSTDAHTTEDLEHVSKIPVINDEPSFFSDFLPISTLFGPSSSRFSNVTNTTPATSDTVRLVTPATDRQNNISKTVSCSTIVGTEPKQPSTTAAATLLSDNSQLTPGVKEYCSYWLRHGECDYQQQGCLYKHEMPLDRDTLRQLGLRDIPRWYREKHCLGSYLAAGGSGAAFSDQSLKSAVANGVREDPSKPKLAGNWRVGSRSGQAPPIGLQLRRSLYNPRPSPASFNQMSLSRYAPTAPLATFPHGKLRSNETRHGRQQLETLQALDVHARLNHGRRRTGRPNAVRNANGNDADVSASELEDIQSRTSTLVSDIEALVGRRDDERKAKEDAEYAETTDNPMKKDSPCSTVVSPNARGNTSLVSASSRRGGRHLNNRGRAKKATGNPANPDSGAEPK